MVCLISPAAPTRSSSSPQSRSPTTIRLAIANKTQPLEIFVHQTAGRVAHSAQSIHRRMRQASRRAPRDDDDHDVADLITPSLVVYLCLSICAVIFFVTRPGEPEFYWQMQHREREPIYAGVLRIVPNRNPFTLLDTQIVTDFLVFTIANLPRNQQQADVLLVGFFGKWFTVKKSSLMWSPDYDVLLACGIYISSYFVFTFAPRFAWLSHTPKATRITSLIASGFACPTFMHTFSALVAMINVGTEVRRRCMTSSLQFWACLIVAPTVSALTILGLDRRGSWPLGPVLGNIALAAFGALADPLERQSFLLFGQFQVGFFGTVFAESTAYLISQPTPNFFMSVTSMMSCLTMSGVIFVSSQNDFSLRRMWSG